MTDFEKYLQFRALSFAFSIKGNSTIDLFTDEQQASIYEANGIEMKYVNVPFPKPTVERLEGVLGQLDMSKRDFVQRAIIDAIKKAELVIETQLDECGVFDKEDEEKC